MPKIRIRNITKSYGDIEVLSDVSLDIENGEFVALLGPSGCGKTTLLRILAGLENPDSGSIWIGDKEVTHLDPAERNIAFVFQSYALYPHKNVYENIAFPLRMRASWSTRVPFISNFFAKRKELEKEIQPQVQSVAEQVGIAPYLERKPGELSGGQRQRVALARSLVRQPQVFLMDEPLSNLDAKLRASMRVDISELQRRLQATFVYVTHDQVEAMTMADRIALMNNKVIQQLGPPMELYNNPANRFVAEFIGSPAINVLPLGENIHGQLTLCGDHVSLLPAEIKQILTQKKEQIFIGVRPDNILVAGPEATGVKCTIRLIEPLGDDAFIAVSANNPNSGLADDVRIVARIDPKSVEQYSLGQPISIAVQWDSVYCFAADDQRIPLSTNTDPTKEYSQQEAV